MLLSMTMHIHYFHREQQLDLNYEQVKLLKFTIAMLPHTFPAYITLLLCHKNC